METHTLWVCDDCLVLAATASAPESSWMQRSTPASRVSGTVSLARTSEVAVAIGTLSVTKSVSRSHLRGPRAMGAVPVLQFWEWLPRPIHLAWP